MGSPDTAGDEPFYRFRRADVVLVDPDMDAPWSLPPEELPPIAERQTMLSCATMPPAVARVAHRLAILGPRRVLVRRGALVVGHLARQVFVEEHTVVEDGALDGVGGAVLYGRRS